MDDLGEAIDGFFVTVIETMYEDQHAAILLDMFADPASCLRFGANGLYRNRGEILQRIWRQFLRPLHLPDLAVGIGRNGNRHRINLQTRSTLAAKSTAAFSDGARVVATRRLTGVVPATVCPSAS